MRLLHSIARRVLLYSPLAAVATTCLLPAAVGLVARGDEQAATRAAVQQELAKVGEVVARGPYRAAWDSLERYTVPDWYQDAKFGIFIHWGVYSVPGFGNEWYPRNMYIQGSNEFKHHLKTYGAQKQFGYKDFIPQFHAERFDAAHWADVFARSGAKFVVPVAEHHDGFAMYDCGFSDWNAVKMGPKRDVVGELSKSVRARGMHFGVSSHRAEHWWFMNGGRAFDSDVSDPKFASLYGPAMPEKRQPSAEYLDDWLARTCELVDKYQPELVWFDWWIEQPSFQPYLQKFASFYYNRGVEWNRGVAINYKIHAFPDRAAVLDIERGVLGGLRPEFWQTDTAVQKNSWGYTAHQDYKTVDSIIDDLVDIASKNGALLLNIGPKPDGTIPAPEEAMLLEIGRWLAVNGEAIYGTRPWKVFGEGPTESVGGSFNDTKRAAYSGRDFRFNAKGDVLYATALAWPEGGKATIKSLGEGSRLSTRPIREVRLLGCDAPLKWSRDADGLTIELPAKPPCDHAYAFKISGVDPARTLSGSLTFGKPARASDVYKNEAGSTADKAVDGALDTRWASGSARSAWLEVDLGAPSTFDAAWIDEWAPGGKRVQAYKIEVKDGETWRTIHKGSTIGAGCLVEFEPVTARVVRLAILDAKEPTINEFRLLPPVAK